MTRVRPKGENPMIKQRFTVKQNRQITIQIELFTGVGIEKKTPE